MGAWVHGTEIFEDVVGIYFWMPSHGVLIWKWMFGEELVVRLIGFILFIFTVFHTLTTYIGYSK